MKLYIQEMEKTQTDKYIEKYLDENLKNLIGMSIIELSKKMNIAVSTLSKFVRKAKFHNFREFQFFLSSELNERNERLELPKPSQKTESEILTIRNHDFYAIDKTSKLISASDLEKSINLIEKSNIVWCIGKGNSNLAALDFSNSLNLMGRISFSTNDIFGTINRIKLLGSNDCVIFFSERFNDEEYYKLIRNYLISRKVKVIVLTSMNKLAIKNNDGIDAIVNFFAFEKGERNNLVRNVKIQQIFLNNYLISRLLNKKTSRGSLDY